MPKKIEKFEERTIAFVMDLPADAAEGTQPETFTFDLNRCSDEMKIRLALHGAKQKIGDSYAGAKESGDPIAYAREAVQETIAQIYDDKWTVARSASGAPRVSLLVQAYAAVKGMSVEQAQEILADLSDDERKVVAAQPRIKAQIALYRAQQAAARAQKLAEAADKAEANAA